MMPPVAVDGETSSLASFRIGVKEDEPQSPRSRRVIRRRHSIVFSGENKVYEFDKAGEDMKDEIWYNKVDYDIIKARNKLIVKMKKTGKFEENDEHSFRGLEHKLKHGFDQRQSNKFNALNAVLEEQDRQFARGLLNADNIAQKYESISYVAREIAFVHGLKDAEESVSFACEEKEPEVADDDSSTVSDLGTVCSEDTVQKKLRLRDLFHGLSQMKKNKAGRRASM